MSAHESTQTKQLVAGLVFPESPRWRDGRLYLTDILAKRVVSAGEDGRAQTVFQHGTKISGIGFLPSGDLLINSVIDRKILRLHDGRAEPAADLKDIPSHFLNDMVVDGLGRAYVNSRRDIEGVKWAEGEIILLQPDGKARVVADSIYSPNGMAISPDNKTIFMSEYRARRILAFDIDDDGSLRHRRVFADLWDRKRARPDGICLDAEGALWISSPDTSEFLRVREGGDILQTVSIKDQWTIACTLGGRDRRTLFMCIAGPRDYGWDLLGDPPNPSAIKGSIETLRVDVPGAGWP